MASGKGEIPCAVSTHMFGQHPAPKAGDNATKGPASKSGVLLKPQEPKKGTVSLLSKRIKLASSKQPDESSNKKIKVIMEAIRHQRSNQTS